MTAKILSAVALLITNWTVVDNTASVRVHVFFKLEQLVCFVVALRTPVLVYPVVVVHTGHHTIVFEEALPAHFTLVGELLQMGRLSVVLQTGLGAEDLATLITRELARLGLLLMDGLHVSLQDVFIFQHLPADLTGSSFTHEILAVLLEMLEKVLGGEERTVALITVEGVESVVVNLVFDQRVPQGKLHATPLTRNCLFMILVHVVLITLESRVGQVTFITSHHQAVPQVVQLVLVCYFGSAGLQLGIVLR